MTSFCSALEVRYATCGELVGERATRCVDEALNVSEAFAAGTLEHVSRILVMRPPLPLAAIVHRAWQRFQRIGRLTGPTCPEVAICLVGSFRQIHIALHQTERENFEALLLFQNGPTACGRKSGRSSSAALSNYPALPHFDSNDRASCISRN